MSHEQTIESHVNNNVSTAIDQQHEYADLTAAGDSYAQNTYDSMIEDGYSPDIAFEGKQLFYVMFEKELAAKKKQKKSKDMKCTFTESKDNAKNLANEKELVTAYSLVVSTKDGLQEVVTARWYMGRSNSASIQYCSVWLRGKNDWSHDSKLQSRCGYGSAGGYGYCKMSAAFAEAIDAAGCKLDTNIGGAGKSMVCEAMKTIAKSMGYRGKLLLVTH